MAGEPHKVRKHSLQGEFSLFISQMERMAKVYPLNKVHIKDLRRAGETGKIRMQMVPGSYVEKKGGSVVAARIVSQQKGGETTYTVQYPEKLLNRSGAIDAHKRGDLWHEWAHRIILTELPTFYDEVTVNFIVREAMRDLVTSKPEESGMSLRDINTWERKLVYKPAYIDAHYPELAQGEVWQKMHQRIAENLRNQLELEHKIEGALPIVHRIAAVDTLEELHRKNPHLVDVVRQELFDRVKQVAAVPRFANLLDTEVVKLERGDLGEFLQQYRLFEKDANALLKRFEQGGAAIPKRVAEVEAEVPRVARRIVDLVYRKRKSELPATALRQRARLWKEKRRTNAWFSKEFPTSKRMDLDMIGWKGKAKADYKKKIRRLPG